MLRPALDLVAPEGNGGRGFEYFGEVRLNGCRPANRPLGAGPMTTGGAAFDLISARQADT